MQVLEGEELEVRLVIKSALYGDWLPGLTNWVEIVTIGFRGISS